MKIKDFFLKMFSCPVLIRNEKERLEKELETERLRVVACGVVAMQNTRDSVKERISPNNPYYTASYQDVCRAVDSEIEYRENLEMERNLLNSVLQKMGIKVTDVRNEDGSINEGRFKILINQAFTA